MMQFKIQAKIIRDAFNKVLTVIDKRSARPILTYTHIVTEDDAITIMATDLEVSIKIKLESRVDNPGTFCINSKNLSDILRELPDEEVNFNINPQENLLNLECGEIKFSLLIINSEDYPPLAFENCEKPLKIPATQFLEIIGRTGHAISNDETRMHLNGIYLQEIDSKLRAVATDGHRLSLLDTDINDANFEPLINGIIIPKKGVAELKKFAESTVSELGPETTLQISVDESYLYIKAGESSFLTIRLISREYPKYQAVIPSKTTSRLNMDKETFFNALRRIKIMSNEKSHGIRVKLDESELELSANHPTLGDAKEKIPVHYDGKKMEVGFNAKYLIDTLSTFDDGEISLELNNELSPVLIKSQLRPNYLGIIMPLKL